MGRLDASPSHPVVGIVAGHSSRGRLRITLRSRRRDAAAGVVLGSNAASLRERHGNRLRMLRARRKNQPGNVDARWAPAGAVLQLDRSHPANTSRIAAGDLLNSSRVESASNFYESRLSCGREEEGVGGSSAPVWFGFAGLGYGRSHFANRICTRAAPGSKKPRGAIGPASMLRKLKFQMAPRSVMT